MNIQNYQRFWCEQKDFGVFWLIESIWTIPGYPIFEDQLADTNHVEQLQESSHESQWERPRSLTTSTGSWKTSCPDAQTSTIFVKPMGLRIAKYLYIYRYTVYIYIYTHYISLPHISIYGDIHQKHDPNMVYTHYLFGVHVMMKSWNVSFPFLIFLLLAASWFVTPSVHPKTQNDTVKD